MLASRPPNTFGKCGASSIQSSLNREGAAWGLEVVDLTAGQGFFQWGGALFRNLGLVQNHVQEHLPFGQVGKPGIGDGGLWQVQ